jgi:SPP1 gp7 family putative phage head morphogenesis protein
MKWGAHKADVRIATNNARKIQAALRQGIDAKRVIAAYRRSQPNATKNPTQDRARARAWAMLNMRINNEPLLEVLQKTWADGFVLGEAYADEAVAKAREAKKADSPDYIDWDNWRPGDAATATLLRPPKAFQELLGSARVTIKDLDQTGYDRVGTALADSIEQGLSDTRAAKLINDAIGNPARALSIAITETNRAMSYGAISRYKAAKLERMEWETSDPCPTCAMNSGQVIEIGGTFNSGAQMPPAHPHCRCALLPVIPEFETNENGVMDIMPKPEMDEDLLFAPRQFDKGQDEEIYAALKQDQGAYIDNLTQKQLKAVAGYQSEGTYDVVNDYLRGKRKTITAADKDLLKTLDEVIDNASFDYNMTLYRGIADDTGDFTKLKIGDQIVEKGYSSTSPNPAVAEAFANSTVIEGGKPVVLSIELPYGHPALASDVASNRLFGMDMVEEDEMMIEITGFTRLNEVTLPRNTTFEVTEVLDKENARYVKVRIKQ